MRSLLNKFTLLLTVIGAVLLMAACNEGSDSEQSERNVQKSNYEKLVAKEPAKEVTNPKTRETVNFFTDTWNEEGQLAYVYLQNSEGKMIGYYVLDGPPVSMCTALTPNQEVRGGGDSRVVVDAPGIDGVYRSAEDCSRYFGKDASSGAYIEFTVGMGINMLLYTEPLTNHPNVENLAPVKEEANK